MISDENTRKLYELGHDYEMYQPKRVWSESPNKGLLLTKPTLPQLLEEVEKRGYKFNMGNMKLNYWKSNYWFNCNLGSQVHISKEAPTKEDAVAQALIQILGEE